MLRPADRAWRPDRRLEPWDRDQPPLQGTTPVPRRQPEAALMSRFAPVRSAVPHLHVFWANWHLLPLQDLAARIASFSPAELRQGRMTTARNQISPVVEPEASVLRSTLRSEEGPMVSARPAWRKMGQGHGNVRLLSRARPCQVLRLVDAGAVRHVTQFLVASLWPHPRQLQRTSVCHPVS